MITIGHLKFGVAPLLTVAVFIALSICAITAAFHHADNQETSQLVHRIIIYEGMALLVTLVYGVCAHFALMLIGKLRA